MCLHLQSQAMKCVLRRPASVPPTFQEVLCAPQGFVDLALLCTFKRMRDILGVQEEMKRPSVPITMVQMVSTQS